MEGKVIEIHPIDKKSWHGKKGVESFARDKTITALVNPTTYQYETGLDESDIKYLRDQGITYNLDSNYTKGKSHEFWDTPMASVKLANSLTRLNTNNPLEFIKWKIILKSRYVANSKEELDQGLFPYATHVIVDEQKEIAKEASKVAIRNGAIIKVSKLTRVKKNHVLLILDDTNHKNSSDDLVDVKMNELINTKVDQLLELLNKDNSEIADLALVKDALNKSILSRRGDSIKYFETVIGASVEDAVKYLQKPANQEVKIAITEAVNT